MPLAGSSTTAVLHIALEPKSGVWSVIRDVCQAQIETERYRAIAIGVIKSRRWAQIYEQELKSLGVPYYLANTIATFGTAQFLWQILHSPPIGDWVDDLFHFSGVRSVVIHMHDAWLSGVFLPIRTRNHKHIKTVVTFHGICTTLQGQPIRRWLHRRMAQRLNHYGAQLTSVDRGNLPLAESIFSIPRDRFTVVPNGVKADQTLSALSWEGNEEFVIGYIGLLAEHKGWRILGEAVLRLRQGGHKIRLLIAGAGPQQEDARRMALAHPGIIEFLGYVSNPRKNVMPRLHALCLPSAYEGLPMVLLEATSVGLPTIATQVGGISEIVQNGLNGLIVSRCVADTAKAIATLYDSPPMARRMGIAARALHAHRFEIRKVVELYHEVYTC